MCTQWASKNTLLAVKNTCGVMFQFPALEKIAFPGKKTFGNLERNVVEKRQKECQPTLAPLFPFFAAQSVPLLDCAFVCTVSQIIFTVKVVGLVVSLLQIKHEIKIVLSVQDH